MFGFFFPSSVGLGFTELQEPVSFLCRDACVCGVCVPFLIGILDIGICWQEVLKKLEVAAMHFRTQFVPRFIPV